MAPARILGPALALPALLITACSSTPEPATAGAATPTSASADPSAAPAVVRTPRLARTTAPGRCVSTALASRIGRAEGAAGHTYFALLLINRGHVTCLLDGYPGVSFTAGDDAHRVGAPGRRDGRYPPAPVRLAPGATAHVTVAVPSDYRVYDGETCRPAASTGLRIYPPGSTGSLLVRDPTTVCTNPALHYMSISVVRPGRDPD